MHSLESAVDSLFWPLKMQNENGEICNNGVKLAS